MANSGITLADRCVDKFLMLQKHHKLRYIIFTIQDETKVDIKQELAKEDETAGLSPQERFNSFSRKLMEFDAAYAVYDAEYTTPQNVKREKVVFLQWAKEDAPVRMKMMYSSTKETVRKKLNGVHADVQACDSDDLVWETVVEKIERFK